MRVGRSGHLVHGPESLPDHGPPVNQPPPDVRPRVSRACVTTTARIGAVKTVTIKRALGVGVVTGLVYAAYRTYRSRVAAAPPTQGSWEAAPFPFPPIPRPAPATASAPTPALALAPTPAPASAPTSARAPRPTVVPDFLERSTEPDERGACPDSHPIKGKLTSGIYHEPGGLNYTRTRADRCYLDAAAAESDGLRAAKR